MRILLVEPRGFCAGVEMAIAALDAAIVTHGTPLYAYHEIVHNSRVVDSFRRRGVMFVDRIADVPRGATVVFSAHGVSPEVRREAALRELTVVDATCPLVAKVHAEAVRRARDGYRILLVGHAGHDEVVGTVGEAPDRITTVASAADVGRVAIGAGEGVAYLTQTTLASEEANPVIAAIRARFSDVREPPTSDICYATTNRQAAVRRYAPEADVVIVVGSPNSSNSRRLVEVAEAAGRPAYLVDGAADLDDTWFAGARVVLVTAGASAPDESVRDVVTYLQRRHGAAVESRTLLREDVAFSVPVAVRATGGATPVGASQ